MKRNETKSSKVNQEHRRRSSSLFKISEESLLLYHQRQQQQQQFQPSSTSLITKLINLKQQQNETNEKTTTKKLRKKLKHKWRKRTGKQKKKEKCVRIINWSKSLDDIKFRKPNKVITNIKPLKTHDEFRDESLALNIRIQQQSLNKCKLTRVKSQSMCEQIQLHSLSSFSFSTTDSSSSLLSSSSLSSSDENETSFKPKHGLSLSSPLSNENKATKANASTSLTYLNVKNDKKELLKRGQTLLGSKLESDDYQKIDDYDTIVTSENLFKSVDENVSFTSSSSSSSSLPSLISNKEIRQSQLKSLNDYDLYNNDDLYANASINIRDENQLKYRHSDHYRLVGSFFLLRLSNLNRN